MRSPDHLRSPATLPLVLAGSAASRSPFKIVLSCARAGQRARPRPPALARHPHPGPRGVGRLLCARRPAPTRAVPVALLRAGEGAVGQVWHATGTGGSCLSSQLMVPASWLLWWAVMPALH